MLDLKALLTKILKCLYTSGTDNGWTYKKYMDGTYEAWTQYNATGLNLTTASAGTYYSTAGVKRFPLPSFISTVPYILTQETASMSSGIWIYQAQRNNTNLEVWYRAHASTTNGVCNGMFYIRGTWGGVINLIKYYLTQPNTFSFERGCVVC